MTAELLLLKFKNNAAVNRNNFCGKEYAELDI